MFHTILLTSWTFFHGYILWSLFGLPLFRGHRFRRWALIIAVAVIWATYFLPDNIGRIGLGFLSEPLNRFTMNWLGTTFLIFTCLLICDIVTLFGLLFKKYVGLLRGMAFVAGGCLALIALYQGYRAPVIRDYEIQLSNLPPKYDGTVLVALSDLHLGTFLDEQWLAERVAQVNALHPDIVVLLGDLFEGDSPGERKKSLMHLFHDINARLGVWGVTGNHESHGDLDSTIQFLEASGVRMLRNQWSEVEPGLVLAGIDDGGYRSGTRDTSSRIERALVGRPDSCATIFLSHRPVNAEKAAAEGVGLMLSGHTHGGQLWPFTYISGLANPLLAGEYTINGMPVIVSRGTGSWGPRMRLWYPGEIVRITIRSK